MRHLSLLLLLIHHGRVVLRVHILLIDVHNGLLFGYHLLVSSESFDYLLATDDTLDQGLADFFQVVEADLLEELRILFLQSPQGINQLLVAYLALSGLFHVLISVQVLMLPVMSTVVLLHFFFDLLQIMVFMHVLHQSLLIVHEVSLTEVGTATILKVQRCCSS